VLCFLAARGMNLPTLTSDQLEEIREAFKLFDTDDSGTIDSDGERARDAARVARTLFLREPERPASHRRAQGGDARDGLRAQARRGAPDDSRVRP
jgi:hypothetical protein